MKNLIVIIVVLFLNTGFAQQNIVEPTYKAQEDLVVVTNYYEDGSIKETGFYKNKKLHGEWKLFNQEGDKIVNAFYVNGKKTGTWMFLNDGVLSEVKYSENKITSVNNRSYSNKTLIN